MGDPGLASKAVEMQQDDLVGYYNRSEPCPRDLDIARVEQQLRETTNSRYRHYLQQALRSLKDGPSKT